MATSKNAGVIETKERNGAHTRTSVDESIQRGKAAVAEAESHIQMFEEYLRSSVQSKDAFERNIASTNTGTAMMHSPDNSNNLDTCVEINSFMGDDYILDDPIISRLSLPPSPVLEDCTDKISMIDALIKSGEKRMKRDEVISSARVQGGIKLGTSGYSPKSMSMNMNMSTNMNMNTAINMGTSKSHNANKLVQPKSKPTHKRKLKLKFDPNNLLAARRAMVKEARAADKKDSSQEKQSMTSFKARSLPGGVQAKHNLHALTKAAIGKMNTNPLKSQVSRSGFHANDEHKLDASVVLENDPISSASTRKSRSPKRRKKSKVRKDIYAATTNWVAQDFQSNVDEEGASSNSEEDCDQDLIGLHQQVARLKAELDFKRKQCSESIQALEEETQCQNISDVGIPELERVFREITEMSDKPNTFASMDESNPNTVKDCRKKSVYTRQKQWLEKLDRRNKQMKEKEENDEVKIVTGKPDLGLAKESWNKAKGEHDGLFKSALEKQKAAQRRNLEKDQLKHLNRVREVEKIQALAKEKSKIVKSGIDRRSQNEYADKLSRPQNRLRTDPLPQGRSEGSKSKSIGQSVNAPELKQVAKKENGEDSVLVDTNESSVSFADMNDKDFAKMIKKIEVLAKKEIKKKVKLQDVPEGTAGTNGKEISHNAGGTTNKSSSSTKKSCGTLDAKYSPYKSRKK